jgi:hypothetical protein
MVAMAMVGYFFTKFEKEARRQQSIRIKLYGQLPIILLLRLGVPWDSWLVVALGQSEHCHGPLDANNFCCCCLMRDEQARRCFLIDLSAIFFKKELHRWILRNIAYVFYLMNAYDLYSELFAMLKRVREIPFFEIDIDSSVAP